VIVIDDRVPDLYRRAKKKADDDQAQTAIGLILFWPALFLLEGGDGPEAIEYSRLKGEREALERAHRRKNCPEGLPPMKRLELEDEQTVQELRTLKRKHERGEIGDKEYDEARAALLKSVSN
jgi:hypothetical protein